MVTGSYPPQPCGVGDYSFRLVHELQAAGVIVDVITTRSGDAREINEVRYSLTDWRVRNWRSAVAWMSTQSYDLVHVQYPARFYGYLPDLSLLTFTLKRMMPAVPVAVTIHEFQIVHVLRKLTIASIATHAEAVVLTAASEKASIEKWLPWIRRKLHLVHMAPSLPALPVSESGRRELRRQYGINDDDIILGYFGFLHPNKGIERLIRAFALVHGRHPHTRLLVMSLIEPDNRFHRLLTKRVADLKLEDSVVWTGFLSREALSRHIGCTDIAVLPFAEGVSLRRLSFMSALDHAVPTVTTSGEVDPETLGLRDGLNVLLTPAGDSPQRLADTINRLVESTDLRVTLRENAKEWMKPYQWSAVVQESLALYSALQNIG